MPTSRKNSLSVCLRNPIQDPARGFAAADHTLQGPEAGLHKADRQLCVLSDAGAPWNGNPTTEPFATNSWKAAQDLRA